ncbi:MAG TPA: hypothetical protein ENI98_14240 [Gammaproteobacteria bacterium]|nr:hypothetical protein [Gammaproteobacteria bacterium]
MQKKTIPVLSLALLSLVGCLLPLSSKGGYGVDIPVLIKFIPFSQMSMVAPMLYVIGVTYLIIVLFEISGRLRNAIPWYLVISVAGLAVTGISIVEAISHIELFGKTCSSVPQLNSATGSTGPGSGAYLLLFTYLATMLICLFDPAKKTNTPYKISGNSDRLKQH